MKNDASKGTGWCLYLLSWDLSGISFYSSFVLVTLIRLGWTASKPQGPSALTSLAPGSHTVGH